MTHIQNMTGIPSPDGFPPAGPPPFPDPHPDPMPDPNPVPPAEDPDLPRPGQITPPIYG